MAAFSDLHGLCKICEVQEDNILNAYILGSSGLSKGVTIHSDVDVILVLKDDSNRKWKNQNWLVQHGWIPSDWVDKKGFQRDYSGSHQHDVWMYSESTFRKMLNRAVPCAVECIFLPNSAVWKNTVEFQFTCSDLLIAECFSRVSMRHLRRAGMEFATHDKKQFASKNANLKIEKWDLYKSKKTLYFSLRFLEMARQLIEHKDIVDREKMLVWKDAFLAVNNSNWSAHMNVYESLHSVLLMELEKALGDVSFNALDCCGDMQYFGNSNYWCHCENCGI